MLPGIDQLEAFSAVVETESFTRAAERLGLSRSLISRRIAQLELELGVRLLNRTTHYVTPTTLGYAFHDRVKRILQEMNDAVGYVTGAISEISGLVRISAPTLFGTMYLTSAVQDILAKHPRLELVLDLTDQPGDLFSEGTDFALRIGILKDSSLIAKYFKPVRQVVVCSPYYAKKNPLPIHPRDLVRHECLVYSNPFCPPPWRFRADGQWLSQRPNARLSSNNPESIRDAAIAGMGIAVLPMFVVSNAISNGDLIMVMEDHPLEDMGLFALFPPNALLPAKVRVVVDFLAARWKKPLPDASGLKSYSPVHLATDRLPAA
ncbi:LysR family transcriptional regulator [Rhizobium sp. L9]|uniref:LysR family transcriptional regulator n=1 Tax=Rhizobium sp. L9 TaxID=1340738 RepID=UPI000BEA616D|nr:LysR family transcriptional regulator [Rhizobium sp. L9]PDT30791.1 LysR family transcriptional regulator [Rhizobium sp. L9]